MPDRAILLPRSPLFRIFPNMSGDVTQLLQAIDSGNPQAADELLPLIYDELRQIAAHKMANEKPGQTLQPTALVHEAWLKIAGADHQQWKGREHFFGAAAEAMRRILIDQARRKMAQKRGGGSIPETFHESRIELRASSEEMLAVHEALDELARQEPITAKVVKLRYFTGLTSHEVADILGTSLSTVERHWAYARAWLKRAIADSEYQAVPSVEPGKK